MSPRLWAAIVVIASCSSGSIAPSPAPTTTLASVTTPTATPSAEAEPSPTATPSATPTAIAFPDLPLIAATSDGELRRYRAGSWELLAQVCPSGATTYSGSITSFHVSAGGAHAWFQCDRPGPTDPGRDAFVFDVATRTLDKVAGTSEIGLGPISPDGRQAVFGSLGDCPMPAPTCQTKWVLVDLATDARREILPSAYWLGMEMRWTADGLTYYRPECAEAGCAGPADAGTYRWNGAGWTRITPDRLIEVGPDGRMLLERRRSLSDPSSPVSVVERIGETERGLISRPDGSTRPALGFDGRAALVYLEDDGVVARFEDGREVRRSPARIGAFLRIRSGDWFVTYQPAAFGSGVSTLFAYSVTQGTVASRPAGIPIVGLGVAVR